MDVASVVRPSRAHSRQHGSFAMTHTRRRRHRCVLYTQAVSATGRGSRCFAQRPPPATSSGHPCCVQGVGSVRATIYYSRSSGPRPPDKGEPRLCSSNRPSW